METKRWRAGLMLLAAVVVAIAGRRQWLLALRLTGGGALIAWLVAPVCLGLSRRWGGERSGGILVGYLAVLGGLALGVGLILPPLIRQMAELFAILPRLIENTMAWLEAHRARWPWLQAMPAPKMPELPLFDGTLSLASSLLGGATQGLLMLTLAYYFLRDRQAIGLRLELLIPARFRSGALKTLSAIRREIGAYVRCQLLISLLVGLLSALLLALSGVRAALALGLIAGLFNLIPYFGPVIGAVPAVLMASGGGMRGMLLAALALFIVQQIDALILSPRLLGAACQLHPALVLVAISVGGSLAGVAGMLFSVPILLIFRSIARNWPVRYESI